jgi:hypothetical protein
MPSVRVPIPSVCSPVFPDQASLARTFVFLPLSVIPEQVAVRFKNVKPTPPPQAVLDFPDVLRAGVPGVNSFSGEVFILEVTLVDDSTFPRQPSRAVPSSLPPLSLVAGPGVNFMNWFRP